MWREPWGEGVVQEVWRLMGTQQRGTGHQNPPLNSLIVKESESFIKKKNRYGKTKVLCYEWNRKKKKCSRQKAIRTINPQLFLRNKERQTLALDRYSLQTKSRGKQRCSHCKVQKRRSTGETSWLTDFLGWGLSSLLNVSGQLSSFASGPHEATKYKENSGRWTWLTGTFHVKKQRLEDQNANSKFKWRVWNSEVAQFSPPPAKLLGAATLPPPWNS